MTDEELAALAQTAPSGDHRAFEDLVRRHQDRVVTNCRYLTRHSDDADDLAQEVFVKAFFAMRRFEHRSSFRTWLLRIKANHCFDFLEKQRRQPRAVPVEESLIAVEPGLQVQPSVEADSSVDVTAARVGRVVRGLPATLRLPLVLREVDGFSYDEIAATMHLGLSAVKMRIKRAREEFRRRLAEQD